MKEIPSPIPSKSLGLDKVEAYDVIAPSRLKIWTTLTHMTSFGLFICSKLWNELSDQHLEIIHPV